jgi:ribosomal protein L37E
VIAVVMKIIAVPFRAKAGNMSFHFGIGIDDCKNRESDGVCVQTAMDVRTARCPSCGLKRSSIAKSPRPLWKEVDSRRLRND